MREPKESPWKFYEPRSFRGWLKKSMKPMGYDKALKRKEKLSMAYFFMSLISLNLIMWDALKKRKEVPTVPTESPVLDAYTAQTPTDENKEIFVLNFANFKLKSVEHIDQKELVKRRLEGQNSSS